MAGKAINQHSLFSGNASDVNILVQEKSQVRPLEFEHKRAPLSELVQTMGGVPNGLATLDENGKIPEGMIPPIVPTIDVTTSTIQVKPFNTATLRKGSDNEYSVLELGMGVQLSFLVDGQEATEATVVTSVNVSNS